MRYIGNKTKLLTKIESLVEEKCSNSENFCDIFSGTGSVARYFKKDYLIQSNDLLFFSYCLQYATIKLNKKPKFEVLKKNLGIPCPIDFFNTILVNEIEVDENYFVFNNYSVILKMKKLNNLERMIY